MEELTFGAEAGDLIDPAVLGSDAEPMLILPEFQSWDMGLLLNERDGCDFWKPFEVMQFHGFVRGVEIWIEVAGGRMGWNGKTRYRVAFGPTPEYPATVDVVEAAALIKANVPPTEYVHVSREEWDARHSPSPQPPPMTGDGAGGV